MEEFLDRTKSLIGEDALSKLCSANVAVFGIGGVGSYAVEALARCGIGRLTIIDKDVIDVSNINRQIIADTTTVGLDKVDVCKERILKINPDCKVNALKMFYLPENANEIDLSQYDYIVDAIDTVTAKLALIENATKSGVKIISSMGTGGRLDPTQFEITDIYKTSGDGLSKVMRRELRKRKVEKLDCLYSRETAVINVDDERVISSISFVPSVAGLIIAGKVIRSIAGLE